MPNKLKISAQWKPSGDQPKAIKELTKGVEERLEHQTLLGVTGSGKTFTIANVIQNIGKPTLIIAHNKTLAAQLAQEYREFFPDNAVHYFVSYYDFYQPEAYIVASDTYIEKDAQINEEIDRLRHAATQALLTRKDVIIVASVSAIYGLGSPREYMETHLLIKRGENISRNTLMRKLVKIYFSRTTADLRPGTFRAVGNSVEIMGAGETDIYRIEYNGNVISEIKEIDPISQTIKGVKHDVFIFPAKHFVTTESERESAISKIQKELEERLKYLLKEEMLLEADRLKRRTNFDIVLIREVGYCNGIENYSRHLSGKEEGEPPETLLSYFPKDKDGNPDFLTIIDESHVAVPQIGGMYEGDASRKRNLVAHGFRLPSALDNRPLKFKEFRERVGQTIYTSATPGKYEFENSKKSGQIVEQIIRPTGLIDPDIELRPVTPKESYGGQIQDLIKEVSKRAKKDERSLVTTLTKKMAEDLSVYLKEKDVKAEYLHSEIKTLERIKILTEFRKGKFDCLVGVNLLREGLDLPEVTFIGILDADKEGFLRSETALVQTIGRAARNILGRVILYADNVTRSMDAAIKETNRRREIQLAYNKKNKITPKTVTKKIQDITEQLEERHKRTVATILSIDRELLTKKPKILLSEKERKMNEAVKILDFETAVILRDEIKEIKRLLDKTSK